MSDLPAGPGTLVIWQPYLKSPRNEQAHALTIEGDARQSYVLDLRPPPASMTMPMGDGIGAAMMFRRLQTKLSVLYGAMFGLMLALLAATIPVAITGNVREAAQGLCRPTARCLTVFGN